MGLYVRDTKMKLRTPVPQADNLFKSFLENKSSIVELNIPSSVKTIFDNAFYGCSNLTTININKPKDSISGAPWGAINATINWL